ncbi:MAG TPA: toll/interleukin-1 receptor domain-containing protein [Parafilimonas sp.]|nr:toll/interleukin-1 receptor domain-containing protein [Parafilimonas sp.]
MLTLKRLAIYFAGFLVVVSLVIGLVDWKWLDKYLVNEANKKGSRDNTLNKKIVVVNLERPASSSEGESLKSFRRRIIKLLNTIAQEAKAKNAPEGVVLDIWFSNDTTELKNLEAVLKEFKELNIPVYAAYQINENHEYSNIDEINFEEIEMQHRADLYSKFLAGSDGKLPGKGRYHTFFYPDKDVANYENDIYLLSVTGDSVLIESLARKVYMDLTDSKPLPKREGSVVPLRSPEDIRSKTYTFITDSMQATGTFQPENSAAAAIDMDKNILIVGDIGNDLVDFGDKKIPGPYILTWALSDLLGNNSDLKLPVENLYVIIGQILFFSLFTVLVFALLFKYVKSLQTKPAVIAILAFITGMVFLFIFGNLILSFNSVIPVGHTIVAMIVASFLSWRFAHKFLATGVAEGAQKYDVFISYSRSQGDWVYKNVYEPLAAFRKSNGDKLNIFFDQKSIGIGEAFTAKYMWAIVDTKNFIAVLSEDYYSKNHCRNELDCAVKRKVEKLLNIQLIAFSDKAVPEAFNSFNYFEKNRNADFIKSIEDTLARE